MLSSFVHDLPFHVGDLASPFAGDEWGQRGGQLPVQGLVMFAGISQLFHLDARPVNHLDPSGNSPMVTPCTRRHNVFNNLHLEGGQLEDGWPFGHLDGSKFLFLGPTKIVIGVGG